MKLLDLLAARLGYRKFPVDQDGSWPPAYLITGDGGLRDLRGTLDDGEGAKLPTGGPRLGSDGRPQFFQRGGE